MKKLKTTLLFSLFYICSLIMMSNISQKNKIVINDCVEFIGQGSKIRGSDSYIYKCVKSGNKYTIYYDEGNIGTPKGWYVFQTNRSWEGNINSYGSKEKAVNALRSHLFCKCN